MDKDKSNTESIRAKIDRWIYHPYLFAAALILLLAARLSKPLEIASIILVLAFIAAFTSNLIFRMVLRDKDKAKLFTAFLIFIGFVYSSLFYALRHIRIRDIYIFNPILLFINSAVIVIAMFIFLVFAKVSFSKASKILNNISVILLIVAIIVFGTARIFTQDLQPDLGSYGITINDLGSDPDSVGIDSFFNNNHEESYKELETTESEKGKNSQGKVQLPDIYFIAPDGYTSERNLNEIFQFDNTEFYNFLENKGFFIARKSQSNYANTQLFMSSCFNMGYVTFLESLNVSNEEKYRVITYLSWNSKVAKFLKSKSYKYYHEQEFGSPNPYADYHGCGGYYQSVKEMLEPTMFEIIDNKLGIIRRAQAKCALKRLYDVENIYGPVFAHIQLKQPHPPYVVDENGNAIMATMDEGYMWKQKDNYINQIKYINKELEKWIEYIMKKTNGNVIIIIQGDHGSGSSFDRIDSENGGGWEYPEEKGPMIERMGILNAYYIPKNIDKGLLYDTITPVNSFRVIFDTLFETDYGLVSDDSMYSSKRTPYVFMNVTEKIRFADEKA